MLAIAECGELHSQLFLTRMSLQDCLRFQAGCWCLKWTLCCNIQVSSAAPRAFAHVPLMCCPSTAPADRHGKVTFGFSILNQSY